MTNKLLVSIAGIAAFVGYCFHRGQCAQAVRKEIKEDLGRWEGEGGNDPAVATPSPTPTPQSSYPAPRSEAHH